MSDMGPRSNGGLLFSGPAPAPSFAGTSLPYRAEAGGRLASVLFQRSTPLRRLSAAAVSGSAG
jgi:hypothetical protein